MGGDEFTILLTDIDSEESVERVAILLIEHLRMPVPILPGVESTVGVSIGIALFPEDGQTMDALITRADKALYHVKRQGVTGYQFASRLA
jgi:diguanylate cyclase (GGDEF)-like protein